jgi:hypothetical protein
MSHSIRQEAHTGQKRLRLLKKTALLKNDVFDRIIGTSQLVYNNLLKIQGQNIEKYGIGSPYS